jgi:transcriptional regulator with XRE-family HTH domain
MINPKENTPQSVGQRIKAAREKAGLTQSELATQLGYTSPTAISLIEADERSVKVETLQKIAELLHQDVNYLATGTNNTPSVRAALRADDSFNAQDVKQIESFIDYLMSQKEKKDGRGKNE